MTHWGQKSKSKPAKPVADILRARNEKRTAALIACITAINDAEGPDTVTHSLVAERVGIPVQYVEWKYPSRENLLAMAAR
jgi:hypothetical protein